MSDSQADWQHLEQVVAQFELALQKEISPQIETFLTREETDRFTLLVELVQAELEYRLKEGRSVWIEEYLKRFPELKKNEKALQELIISEYVLRLRMDPQIDVSDYVKRFPQLGESLMAKLHQAAKQDQPNRFTPHADEETVLHVTNSGTNNGSLPLVDQPKQNLPFQQFDRYVIKELLGEGAFGQVYLAYDPKAKRNVALKVPRRRLQSGSEEDRRFLREARAVAALQHQNICPLFDLLETNDGIVLVMPYIEGGSLAEINRQLKFSLEESILLVRTLTSAMAYAHDAGVIHRDLKPANILIDSKQSQPVITDFGLALFDHSDETKLTQQGQLLGTPAYMSPEQASGDTERISSATDIYALGMILYELCTGKLPFTGSSSAVIGQTLSKEPAAPSSLNPDIPPALEEIILKAIAKNPTDRFTSMDQFAITLKQLQPTEQEVIASKTTIKANSNNHSSKWWITTVLALLFLASGVWMLFQPSSPGTESIAPVSQKPSESLDSEKPVSFEQADLLKQVDITNDAFSGDWSRTPQGLLVTQQEYSRLTVPARPNDSFQLDLELTRNQGKSEVNLIFPVGKSDCMLSLGRRDDWCGLQHVNGQDYGRIVANHLSNGIRHQLTLSVSSTKQEAIIKATIDGKPILDWQGPVSALTLRNDWKIRKHSLGLGAHYDEVLFHSLKLTQ